VTEPFLLSLDSRTEQLRSIIEPVIEDEGYELVWLVLIPGAQRVVLRIFVDTHAADTHIDLTALEKLNRLLGSVLDVEDQHQGLFRGQYNLEVSSPGLDRPLAKRAHFESAIGQKVKIRSRTKIGDGGRGLTSKLTAVSDEGIELLRGDGAVDTVMVSWADLDDAHVVFEFESQTSPRPKRAKNKASKKRGNPKKQDAGSAGTLD
jgi:ribosome maturation factor RimP